MKIVKESAVIFSWAQIDAAVSAMAGYCKSLDKKFTGVLGLAKGGLIPATMLAYKLNLPLLMNPVEDCIIVDDDCWSGVSLMQFNREGMDKLPYTILLIADRYTANTGKKSLAHFAYMTLPAVDVIFPWTNLESDWWLTSKEVKDIDYEEYEANRKPIIAVDFDNTLRIGGKPNEALFNIIKERNEDIDFILWTCRVGKDLIDAIKFCEENGWSPKYVNENVEKDLPDCRKVFADYYIDDLSVYQDDETFFNTLKYDIGQLIKQ